MPGRFGQGPGGGLPPGVIPAGMVAQQVPRQPTAAEITAARLKQRCDQVASFAANLLQNAVHSGEITITGGDKEFSDGHVTASLECADAFFAGVDAMVAAAKAEQDAIDSAAAAEEVADA